MGCFDHGLLAQQNGTTVTDDGCCRYRECAMPALINLTLAQFNQAVQIAWKVGLLIAVHMDCTVVVRNY